MKQRHQSRKFETEMELIMKGKGDRKPPMPRPATILSKKDKHIKKDTKKGRKNWTDYNYEK